MTVCLICLIGLPATGKSTLVNHLITHFGERKYLSDKCIETIPIVYDKEIEWNEEEDEGKWKEKRTYVFNKVETIFSTVCQSQNFMDKANLIILDDNMYYRSMRYSFYRLARKFESSYCQIYLSLSQDIVLQRNANRNSSVPDRVIERMSTKLEVPNKEKYAWELNTLEVYDYNITAIETVVNFINKSLENPLQQPKVVEELKNDSRSSIHIADLALRQIVKTEIQKCLSSNPLQVSRVVAELSKKRINLLADIKSGLVSIPDQDPNTSDAVKEYLIWLYPIMLQL